VLQDNERGGELPLASDLVVPVTQLGSTFKWLLHYGVTSERIGSAFGLTGGNVRVIASRAWMVTDDRAPQISVPSTPLVVAEKIALGIRPSLDETVDSKDRRMGLDAIREALQETIEAASGPYDFDWGVSRLRRLLPKIGYPADSRRIDLSGQIHFRLAWYLCHLGRNRSAITHASTAMNLFRAAYHESDDASAVDRFVLAGLVRSQSLLLDQRPRSALKTLDLLTAAAGSVGSPLGSDHFRQRGVATLQMIEDDAAEKYFVQSAQRMDAMGEAQSLAQVAMTGNRHIFFLGIPNVDGMLEIRQQALATFGPASLEASMATNWAAAAAFSTNSSSFEDQAILLLHENAATAARFGHQKTVDLLLTAVPSLGLYPLLQRKFVRRALYENAFRRK
jgi:hypothetical protein